MFLYGIAVVLFLFFLYYITRDRGNTSEAAAAIVAPFPDAIPSSPAVLPSAARKAREI
jgi:hypothetical protein